MTIENRPELQVRFPKASNEIEPEKKTNTLKKEKDPYRWGFYSIVSQVIKKGFR